MRGRRAIWILPLAVLACGPAAAVTGVVVAHLTGKPMEGVSVCLVHGKVKQECVLTDAGGAFELPDSELGIVVVDSREHLPGFAPAEGHHSFRLVESPQLLVHLIDAVSGEPIVGGEVHVLFPSAIRRGPFPTGRGGVRISRLLEPGEIRVLARAEGYEDPVPRAVRLEAGEETQVTIRMEPLGKSRD
jgi:hypothetical protein